MPERDLIERLDDAIEAILGGGAKEPVPHELAMLVVIADDLRGLPDPRFKQELKRRILPMTTATLARTPAGFHTVTPYLAVDGTATKLTEFLKEAFGATVLASVPRPDGLINHSELLIGDSIVELADAPPEQAHLAEMHLYVENADAVYGRAIAAGARSLHEPTDQPYGDREAGIADPAGNYWYIATHGAAVRPEGLRSVTPFLHARGAASLIDFLKNAFDARETSRDASPDGTIHHAVVHIGDSAVEIGEAHGQWQPMPCGLHLFVDDADGVYESALRAGAKSLFPLNDAPYGQRIGGVTDQDGNRWYIATLL